MASAGPLRRCAAVILIAGLGLVLGGLGSRVALAVFSGQASNGDNAFTTASCFPGDTGWVNPSAEAADTGGNGDGFELNPTNAFADGAGYASNIDNQGATGGDRHRFYNYGLPIGSTCAINGIEVRLDWWLDNLPGIQSLDVELSWDGGTSWTSAKTDPVETKSEHTAVLGGSADTWGRTWTVAELSDANFRIRLTCTSSNNKRDFFLDWVPVKVYYGPP